MISLKRKNAISVFPQSHFCILEKTLEFLAINGFINISGFILYLFIKILLYFFLSFKSMRLRKKMLWSNIQLFQSFLLLIARDLSPLNARSFSLPRFDATLKRKEMHKKMHKIFSRFAIAWIVFQSFLLSVFEIFPVWCKHKWSAHWRRSLIS